MALARRARISGQLPDPKGALWHPTPRPTARQRAQCAVGLPPTSPTERDTPRAAGTDGEKATEEVAPQPPSAGGARRGCPVTVPDAPLTAEAPRPRPHPCCEGARLVTHAALSSSGDQP